MKRFGVSVALSVVLAGGWGCQTAPREEATPAPGSAGVDPAAVSPETYRVLLENDVVRVLLITAAPGARDEMHSHPVNAWYAVRGGTLRLHTPDGASRDVEAATGQTGLQDAVAMHSMENIGAAELELVMVELKGAPPAGTTGPDPAQVSPEVYRVLAENDHFRILEVTSPPGARDQFHGHPTNVFYVLSGGSGVLHLEGGDPATVQVEPGQARFQDAVERHSLENTGATPIRLVLFELKGA